MCAQPLQSSELNLSEIIDHFETELSSKKGGFDLASLSDNQITNIAKEIMISNRGSENQMIDCKVYLAI